MAEVIIDIKDEWTEAVTVTVTRSAGDDGAVLILIDTPSFEPDGSDGGPGLRVLINDADAYVGVPYSGGN